MKKQLNDATVAAGELADLLGLSRTRISQLGKSGVLVKAKQRGRYVLVPSLKNYITGLRARAGSEGDATMAQIRAARLRNLSAQADTREHALSVEKGRYMLKEDALAAGARAGAVSRAAWEAIEDELPPFLEGLSGLQMKSKLRDYGRKKCSELAAVFSAD